MLSRGPTAALLLVFSLGCVVSATPTNPCIVTNGTITYDLTALTTTYISYDYRENDKYIYYVNLCGPLLNVAGVTDACLQDDPSTSLCQGLSKPNSTSGFPYALGAFVSSKILPSGGIEMVYQVNSNLTKDKCNGGYRSASIFLSCGPDVGLPAFKEEESGCIYNFEWQTQYACQADESHEEMNCQYVDLKTDRVYDLSSLRRHGKNWRALDVRQNEAYVYEINVCETIVRTANVTGDCIKLPTGACQTKEADESTWSLGRPLLPSFQNGNIVLHYDMGTPCGKGFNRSAVIYFECDENGGQGVPEFLQEDGNCSYIFTWSSRAACPIHDLGTGCRVYDDDSGSYLDFNRLKNITFHIEQQANAKVDELSIDFAVCSPLPNSACGSDAAVCVTDISKNNMTFHIGRPSDTIFVESGIPYIYSVGNKMCAADQNYSTVIEFACDPNDSLVAKVLPQSGCIIRIGLYTSAACPAKTVECAAFDDDSHRAYDLSQLTNSASNYRLVDANPSEDFIINVCRSIVTSQATLPCGGADVGACLLRDGAGTSFGSPVGPTVVDGQLYLNFVANDSNAFSLLVKLTCAPLQNGPGHPVYQSMEGKTYYASWATSAACPLQMDIGTDCKVVNTNSGHQYDLNSVHTTADISIGLKDGGQIRISACGPLAKPCGTDATAAVCLEEKGKPAVSIGAINTNVTLTAEENMIMEFTSPTATCNSAVDQSSEFYNSVVQFYCHKPDGPSLSYVSGCTYVFLWPTLAACAQTECVVSDPATGDVYDLSGLALTGSNWQAEDRSGNVFEFNVCKRLEVDSHVQLANCPFGVAACRFSKAKPAGSGVDVGHVGVPTVASQGELELRYLGGVPCPTSPGIMSSTTLFFTCDQSAGYGLPSFEATTNECESIFTWPTALACAGGAAAPDTVDCTATDSDLGYTYNLSPLTNRLHNYVATSINGTRADFQLNVCSKLVEGTHSCSGQEAACLTNSNLDLGTLDGPPTVEDGQLLIRYSGGDNCSSKYPGSSGPSHTIINFNCPYSDDYGDALLGIVGLPSLVSVSSTCEFVFVWETSAACPIEETWSRDCEVTDMLTGLTYDLSPLNKKAGWEVEGKVVFNPCAPVSGICSNNAMACLADGTLNLGNDGSSIMEVLTTTQLLMVMTGDVDGSAAGLNLTGGMDILYVCNETAGDGEPHIIFQDGWEFGMVWSTVYACPPALTEVDCVAVDDATGTTYDLTALMSREANFEAADTREDGKYVYLINVCGTLVPDGRFPNCPSSAAACQVSAQKNIFTEVSLGRPAASPQFVDGQLFIQYEDGQPCSGKNRTTRINFFCADGASTGSPVFLQEINCVYLFAWYTSYACDDSGSGPAPAPAMPSSNCMVADPVRGVMYDLSPLSDRDVFADTKFASSSESNYLLSVCKPLQSTLCGKGVGACQVNATNNGSIASLGESNAMPFLHPGTTRVALRYTEGQACVNSNMRETLIIFECDSAAGRGIPVYSDTTEDCTTVFTWRTNVICSPQTTSVPCLITVSGSGAQGSLTYDLSPLTRTAGQTNNRVWEAQDPMTGAVYFINLCELTAGLTLDGSTPVPAGCAGSAICKKVRKNNQDVGSGMAGVGRPSMVSGALVVRAALLPGAADRAANCTIAYSQILFNCYPGLVGSPVFVSYDGCILLFSWDTYLACAEEPILSHTPSIADDITGFTFDLTGLKGRQAKVSLPNNGGTLYFALFDQLNVSSGAPKGCLVPGAAVCISQGSTTKPEASVDNYNLTFADNVLSLSYNGVNDVSTIIVFACDASGSAARPLGAILVKMASGAIVLEVSSIYACLRPQAVDCTVADRNANLFYDLSPLATNLTSWSAVNTINPDNFVFEVSVCHSGISSSANVADVGVCEDAGLCQIQKSTRKPYNLGGTRPPSLSTDNVLQLQYANGDSCGNNYHRSSTINMTCGASLFPGYPLGCPVYVGESATCRYQFSWQSPAACPVIVNSSRTCEVTDPATGIVYDLSPLRTHVLTAIDSGQQTYLLSLCGQTIPCGNLSDVVVCQHATNKKEYSLGSSDGSALNVYEGHLYTNTKPGSPCNGGSERSAHIEYVCDRAATLDKVHVVATEDACLYSFTVATAQACAGAAAPSPPAPGKRSNSKKSNPGVIIGIAVVLIVVLLVATFMILKRRGVAMPSASSFTSCCQRRSSVRYALVSDFYSNNNDDNDDMELDATWAE